MTEPKIKLIGDSHCRFIEGPVTDPAKGVIIDWTHGKNILSLNTDDMGDAIRIHADCALKFDAYDTILDKSYDLIVYSGPLHSSLVTRHQTWHDFCHWSLAENFPARQPVSTATLKAVAGQQIANSMRCLALARQKDITIAVLEPPKLSRRALEYANIDEKVFTDIDARFRNLIRSMLAEIDVPVIDTPAQTHDGIFLKPAFQAKNQNDLHHGNFPYGRAALASIFEYAERLKNKGTSQV